MSVLQTISQKRNTFTSFLSRQIHAVIAAMHVQCPRLLLQQACLNACVYAAHIGCTVIVLSSHVFQGQVQTKQGVFDFASDRFGRWRLSRSFPLYPYWCNLKIEISWLRHNWVKRNKSNYRTVSYQSVDHFPVFQICCYSSLSYQWSVTVDNVLQKLLDSKKTEFPGKTPTSHNKPSTI